MKNKLLFTVFFTLTVPTIRKKYDEVRYFSTNDPQDRFKPMFRPFNKVWPKMENKLCDTVKDMQFYRIFIPNRRKIYYFFS